MNKFIYIKIILIGLFLPLSSTFATTPPETLVGLVQELENLDTSVRFVYRGLSPLADRTIILRADDWRKETGLAYNAYDRSWLTDNFPDFFKTGVSSLRLSSLEISAQCMYFQLLLQEYEATTNCKSFKNSLLRVKEILCIEGLDVFCPLESDQT